MPDLPPEISPLSLPNNAADKWYKDPGLRSLTLPILVGFASSVSQGYDGSLINGLLANKKHFVSAIDNPDPNKLGLIVAAYTLGSIPGLFPSSYLADRYGRRVSLTIGCIIIVAGACVQALTTGGWHMFGGRFIIGMGSSFCGVSGFAYTVEIAHPRNRSQVSALINTTWYIGAIIAAWTTFATGYWDSAWSWRLPCLVQVVTPLFQLVSMPFVPESPRYLVSKGREDEAHCTLAKYHANGDMDDELVLYELQEIKEAIETERTAPAGVTYASFLKTPGNRHRLAILIMVGFFSQWVGNGIISYYLVAILESVGMTSPAQQQGFNGGLQIWNWFLAVGGSLCVERLGRRKLWLTSAIGMFVTFCIIMGCSAAYSEHGLKNAGPAVMAFLFLYFGFYDIAFTGLTIAYPLEILPYSLRTRGMAIVILCIMLAAFFNQYVNPIALAAIQWRYYGVYIVIQAISIVCIYLYYPETKGLLLEEVATVFDGPKAVPSLERGSKDDIKDGVRSQFEAV
ncbi:hypothetical protein CspeluHIS016_0603260 [Cutaneotrichosporon spelunceum]|uniref:Major facilitator superfamily (MFS) profile domain-containing protein n=1 Tax=Cutaneotrichosporon spelunceum TaxID=1672016 RepID=A0AAD3YEC9_9TREE|nr:hypothetical protein CspeluHIS016_0603260 [Cutaneotrichosporon spelunceum]